MEGYGQPEGIIKLDIFRKNIEDNDYMESIFDQLLQKTEEVKMLREVIRSAWEILGAGLKLSSEPQVMNRKGNNKANDQTSRSAASNTVIAEPPKTSAPVKRIKNKKPNNQTATESTMPEANQTHKISPKGEVISSRNTSETDESRTSVLPSRPQIPKAVKRPAKENGSDQPSDSIPTKEKEIQQSKKSGKSSTVSTTSKEQVAQASSSTPSPFALGLKKLVQAFKPESNRVRRKPDAMDILKPTPTPPSSAG